MSTTQHDDPQLLTVEKVADRLRLGRTKVYELINSGELPHIKFGRACRIPRDGLSALIARKQQETSHA